MNIEIGYDFDSDESESVPFYKEHFLDIIKFVLLFGVFVCSVSLLVR